MDDAARQTSFDRNLTLANEVRIAQGRIKARVKELGPEDGRRIVAAMLASPSGFVSSMRVGLLLRSIRKVGPARVDRWLLMAGVGGAAVSPTRRVRALSPRQRQALIDVLLINENEGEHHAASC